MLDKTNKEDIIKIIIFAIIIILLSVFAIVVHKNYDFDIEEKRNIENIPINDLDPNKVKLIQGVNGIYYYELEDYGDFQIE